MELFSRTFSYFPVFLPARFRYSAQFSIASDPVIPKSYAVERARGGSSPAAPFPAASCPRSISTESSPDRLAPTALLRILDESETRVPRILPPPLITFTYPFGRRGIERLKVKFYANVNGCRIYFASGNVHWKLILNGKEMEKKKKK